MTEIPGDTRKAADEDLTKELASGLRGLFDRIGEFFHLFDLSFFVSGATIVAAGAYWYSHHQNLGYRIASATWVRVLAVVVASYVSGLLAFAAGRAMTYLWRPRWFPEALRNIVEAHALSDHFSKTYLEGRDMPWRLYERLWVDLRESRRHVASFQLLNRYWVMAATYDGIAVASVAWAVVLFCEPPMPAKSLTNCVLPVVAVCAAGLSWWQANNYLKFQLREILATVASAKARLIP